MERRNGKGRVPNTRLAILVRFCCWENKQVLFLEVRLCARETTTALLRIASYWLVEVVHKCWFSSSECFIPVCHMSSILVLCSELSVLLNLKHMESSNNPRRYWWYSSFPLPSTSPRDHRLLPVTSGSRRSIATEISYTH